MEILELVLASMQMCGCFLEIVTLFVDGTAAYSGLRVHQQRNVYREKKARGEPVAPRPPSYTWVWCLALFSVAFTALTLYLRFLRS